MSVAKLRTHTSSFLRRSLYNPYSILDFPDNSSACQSEWFIDGRCAGPLHHSWPQYRPTTEVMQIKRSLQWTLNARECDCQYLNINQPAATLGSGVTSRCTDRTINEAFYVFWYRLKYCTCSFDVSNLVGEFTERRSNGATSRIPLCKNTQMAGWSASSKRARFIVPQFTDSLPRIRRFYIMPLAIHSKNKVEPLLMSRS